MKSPSPIRSLPTRLRPMKPIKSSSPMTRNKETPMVVPNNKPLKERIKEALRKLRPRKEIPKDPPKQW